MMERGLHRFRHIIIDEDKLEWRTGRRHYAHVCPVWNKEGKQIWLIVLNEQIPGWIKAVTLIHEYAHILTLQNKWWTMFIERVDPDWFINKVINWLRRW